MVRFIELCCKAIKTKKMTPIKIGYGLRQFTDRETFHVKGRTPKECLDDLIRQIPGLRNWIFDEDGLLNVSLFINGKIAYTEDLTRKLRDGDELAILQLTDGG